MKKLIKAKKFSRLITVMLVISVIASIFCVSASAASYDSKTKTEYGRTGKLTLQFNSNSWGATGVATYSETAKTIYVSVQYTYKASAGNYTKTVNGSNTNTNSSLVAKTVQPDEGCSANISASASCTITPILYNAMSISGVYIN